MKILDQVRVMSNDAGETTGTLHDHPNLDLLNSLTKEENYMLSNNVALRTYLENEDW